MKEGERRGTGVRVLPFTLTSKVRSPDAHTCACTHTRCMCEAITEQPLNVLCKERDSKNT